MLIEFLLSWLLACVALPDFNEYSQCLDTLVLEYNQMVDETIN